MLRRALVGFSLVAAVSFTLSSAPAATVTSIDTSNAWANVVPGQSLNTNGGTWAPIAPSEVQGSVSESYRSPFDGSGSGNSPAPGWEDIWYYSVGPSPNATVLAQLDFNSGQTSLSFLWGSVDDYNVLQFLDQGGNVFDSVSPDALFNLGADEGSGAAFVIIQGFAQPFFGIRFGSDTNAFEFSNIATTAVPIPPALLLFGSALAGLGYLMRRRRETGPQPA